MEDIYSLFCLPSRRIPIKEATLSIDDACSLVSSGDLVLISGTSYSSYFVTYFCASQWSHIAIVYRRRDGVPMIFEAIRHDDDGSPNVDVITGKSCTGVRLIDMRKFLESFKGNAIAIRLLMSNSSFGVGKELRAYVTAEMEKLIPVYSGLPYEHRLLDFFLARYYVVPQTSMSLDSMFCSKLVAWCYISMGLLSDKYVCANQFLPDDFSTTGDVTLSYPKALPFPGFVDEKKTPLVQLSKELYVSTVRKPPKSSMPLFISHELPSTGSRYLQPEQPTSLVFKDPDEIDYFGR